MDAHELHPIIAVSYTHLVRPVTEKTEIKSSITELIDSVYVREGDQVNKGDVPVSYTHLDVYKRQVIVLSILVAFKKTLARESTLVNDSSNPSFNNPSVK